MSDVINRKRAFASLPIMQALKTIICGFELETQSVDGMTHEEIDDQESYFDEDGYYDEVRHHVEKIKKTAIFRKGTTIGNEGTGTYHGARLDTYIRQVVEDVFDRVDVSGDVNINQLLDLVPENLKPAYEIRFNDHLTDWVERCIVDRDSYTQREDSLSQVDGVDYKADSSVTGPEFIIAGSGTTANSFISRLKALFQAYDLEVDEECSFHIHVSVPGIKHQYGPMLQCSMMEYLLRNVHRVPKRVRDRWLHNTDYFKPRISTDKYSFVNFHERCKTWEFRCFGNVRNAKDGMLCLKLAVEALQYAYKVSLGTVKPLFDHPTDFDSDLFAEVVALETTLERALKDARRYEREAA